MGNVVSIDCTCEYLLQRAEKHRRAGRYDEVMALLWKAKSQFGLMDGIEFAFAGVYDEIGCEREAERAYLRVVHLGGVHKPQALFQLALSAFERGDIPYAASYFEHFSSEANSDTVPKDLAVLLGRQILEAMEVPKKRLTRKNRARNLEQRAASLLQKGKTRAAQRAMTHALRFQIKSQSYTMLACCCLVRGDAQKAVEYARLAHCLSPSNVQTMCVLSDAYESAGEKEAASKVMRLASLRAKDPDDLLAVAIESAKYGNDSLTLHLTNRLLHREPYHTKGMMLRACALTNMGRCKEANQLFARLCGILPEDTICESYFKMTRDVSGVQRERLVLGMDVTREEGIRRAAEMISALDLNAETANTCLPSQHEICRLCDWALHSPLAGSQIKTVACALLGKMDSSASQAVLLDALTDSLLSDGLKLHILQILTEKSGFKPYYVNMNGRLVRLAAGAVSRQSVRPAHANARVVQMASDGLCAAYPDAPQIMLDAYLCYLNRYGHPPKRHEAACAAALQQIYFECSGLDPSLPQYSYDGAPSIRLIHLYLKRFHRCGSSNTK